MCVLYRPYQNHSSVDWIRLFHYVNIKKNTRLVARQFNISSSTLHRHYTIWKQCNEPEVYEFDESRGRMCKLSDSQQKLLYDIICLKIENKIFINDYILLLK